jgi:hypothetical protein
MVAVFQVKRLKALSHRRRTTADACIGTDMAAGPAKWQTGRSGNCFVSHYKPHSISSLGRDREVAARAEGLHRCDSP